MSLHLRVFFSNSFDFCTSVTTRSHRCSSYLWPLEVRPDQQIGLFAPPTWLCDSKVGGMRFGELGLNIFVGGGFQSASEVVSTQSEELKEN